ncbi:MAG: hypothetical protein SWH54_15200 [Thermodesulfobacteriota bacterium]|nr:hypothetical protein [Thermodesulfobacteriota bacterium]
MNLRRSMVFFIAFYWALLPCGCSGGGKNVPMRPSIEKKEKSKPRLIVLPLQPEKGQAYNGIGIGIHFLLGNVVALHSGLKEFWFGWRVKKIFLQKEKLTAYCRGKGPRLDITKLAKAQGIRYWLWGSVQQHREMVKVTLVLKDTKGKCEKWKTGLMLDPADHLIGFRKGFLAWLKACGLPLADTQVPKALWPETTTLKSLDLLGRDLKTYYFHSSWGDKGPLDSKLFDRSISAAPSSYLAHNLKGWVRYKNKDYESAKESFRSAININPNGLGAISGLMWCAVYTNDKEKACQWAMAKADIRGESREAAMVKVEKRMKNLH